MFEWFKSGQAARLQFFLNRLKAIANREIRDASELDEGYDAIGAMMKLVNDETAERLAEQQLVHQFREAEHKLAEKSPALAKGLAERIAAMDNAIQNTLPEILMRIQKSVRERDVRAAAAEKAELIKAIVSLEREISLAAELAEYAEKWQTIPNIYCSAQFREKLKSDDRVKMEMGYLENLLERMSNLEWLRSNSKLVERLSGNFFSCPKGESKLRIIFSLQGNRIMVHDILFHGKDYESFYRQGRVPTYHGPLTGVFRPLRAFALLQ